MLTWAGREATQAIVSATSSAVSASTPSYTSAARSASPWKRTRLNSSVCTMPGATSVTRRPASTVSRRSTSRSALTANLAAT